MLIEQASGSHRHHGLSQLVIMASMDRVGAATAIGRQCHGPTAHGLVGMFSEFMWSLLVGSGGPSIYLVRRKGELINGRRASTIPWRLHEAEVYRTDDVGSAFP